jgi:hypothetical protein
MTPPTAPDAGRRPGLSPETDDGMDGLRSFLETLRDHNLIAGRLRGVLHVAIGRRITKTDGTVLSTGVTWRELAALLKDLRFDKAWVKEFAENPDAIAPRDRERFWYTVIGLAQVDSKEAVAQAEKLAALVKPIGYVIGPSPLDAIPTPGKAAKPAVDKKKKSK